MVKSKLRPFKPYGSNMKDFFGLGLCHELREPFGLFPSIYVAMARVGKEQALTPIDNVLSIMR